MKLSRREEDTIKEVASQYENIDLKNLLTMVDQELFRDTRLKAYDVAHRICAEQERGA
jgi:hypothetical protein